MGDAEMADDGGNPYSKVVNKRLRIVKKKMQKIEALELKGSDELNTEQAALVSSKPIIKILLDELSTIMAAFDQEDKDDSAPAKPEKKEKKGKKGPAEEPAPASAPVADAAPVAATGQEAAAPPAAAAPVDPVVQPAPATAREAAPPASSTPSGEDFEGIVSLFKSLAVISHSYLYLRLCFALENDGQPPLAPTDLKEVAQIAQLVLEMPIPDSKIILQQDRAGQEHLKSLLSNSTDRPNILSPDTDTFGPMNRTYAELRQIITRVSRAMKGDHLLSAHVAAGTPSQRHEEANKQQSAGPAVDGAAAAGEAGGGEGGGGGGGAGGRGGGEKRAGGNRPRREGGGERGKREPRDGDAGGGGGVGGGGGGGGGGKTGSGNRGGQRGSR